MIKRKYMKVGDVIYVNQNGEQTGNEKDIKVTITKKINQVFKGVKYKALIGKQNDYRAIGKGDWSSDYIIVD